MPLVELVFVRFFRGEAVKVAVLYEGNNEDIT